MSSIIKRSETHAVQLLEVSHANELCLKLYFLLWAIMLFNKTSTLSVLFLSLSLSLWRGGFLITLMNLKAKVARGYQRYSQQLCIFHPKSSTKALGLFLKMKCTVLHCCSFVNKKFNSVTSL
jgi:hypothetical protein